MSAFREEMIRDVCDMLKDANFGSVTAVADRAPVVIGATPLGSQSKAFDVVLTFDGESAAQAAIVRANETLTPNGVMLGDGEMPDRSFRCAANDHESCQRFFMALAQEVEDPSYFPAALKHA